MYYVMTYSAGCDTIDVLTLHTQYRDLLWVVMRAKSTHCQQTPQLFSHFGYCIHQRHRTLLVYMKYFGPCR